MAGIRLAKPWLELTAAAIDELPAQLGVYQIADAEGIVTKIGYAGGRETFGIRTALERELQAGGQQFRAELTHGYLTRWEELLMIHQHDHGELPPGNTPHVQKVGRLSIDGPNAAPPTKPSTTKASN